MMQLDRFKYYRSKYFCYFFVSKFIVFFKYLKQLKIIYGRCFALNIKTTLSKEPLKVYLLILSNSLLR